MSKISEILQRVNDLSDPLDPIGEQQLAAFEAEIGYRLPEYYREFLLLHNGGVFHFRSCYRECSLEVLFGLTDELNSRGLQWHRDSLLSHAPNWLLFIGSGLSSYYTCVSLRPHDYGRIWVWDSDILEAGKMACLNVTFPDLLERLEPSADALEDARKDATKSGEPFRSLYLYDLPGLIRYFTEGGTVEGRDYLGRTPLIHAASDWPNVVPTLLKQGADVEACDNLGQTALYRAASCASFDSVRALLSYGANPLALTDSGDTPLSMAQGRGDPRIVRLLQEYADRMQ